MKGIKNMIDENDIYYIDDEPIYKGLFWDAETKKFYRWEDLPKEIKDVD